MDDLRFDRFVQSLAVPGSRRRFLAGLAAGALGLAGSNRAAARTCSGVSTVCREDATCCSGKCGPKDRTGRRRCACKQSADCPVPDGCHVATCNNGVCGAKATVDFAADPNNCGGCGRVCPTDPYGTAICVAGVCGLYCIEGDVTAGGSCLPPFGTACTMNTQCASGVCACTDSSCEQGMCASAYALDPCRAVRGGAANVNTPSGAVMICVQDTFAECPCSAGQVCGVSEACFVPLNSNG